MRPTAVLRRAGALCGLLAAAQCSHGDVVAEAPAAERYTATLNSDWSRLDVDACFPAGIPRRLQAGSEDANKFLMQPGIRLSGISFRPNPETASVDLGAAGDDRCLAYSVAIGEAASRQRGRLADDRAILFSPGTWLWRPARISDAARLQFDLPDGVDISAPWPLLERHPGRAVYRLVDTPTRWPARMAIGRFPVRELEIGGARLRLAVIAGTPAADNEAVAGWLEESAAAVATLYGRFPLPQAQLLVVPLGPQSEPVPWGQVLRGGGPAAHLFIDQTRPDNEWRADWTAVHELSHMLMPYISRHDAWLSEGFASYYQNVLRARAGMISEADAWRKLTAGFERGRKGTRPGVTLSAASRQMRRERAFMRVYWSGAAIALLADMRLREAGDGLSLDVALSRLAECCLPSNRMWTARQALDRLDSLTGTDVFARLGERYRDSDEFPDVAPLLDALGVIGQGEALRFDDRARLATSRRTLMGAPNPASVQR